MDSDQCCVEKPDGSSQVEGQLRGSLLHLQGVLALQM